MCKEFTCIVCPVSCTLKVSKEGEEIIVKGNNCKRGKAFGENEYKAPKRMLTTTVKVVESYHKALPVISSEEIPKEKILECVEQLYKITVKAPIKKGQIIIKNILDTGVDVVASRSLRHI